MEQSGFFGPQRRSAKRSKPVTLVACAGNAALGVVSWLSHHLGVFSVEERGSVRQRVLRLAEEDPHVVATAEVGSLAVGGGDRWSVLDLTFEIAGAEINAVLDEWTRRLSDESLVSTAALSASFAKTLGT